MSKLSSLSDAAEQSASPLPAAANKVPNFTTDTAPPAAAPVSPGPAEDKPSASIAVGQEGTTPAQPADGPAANTLGQLSVTIPPQTPQSDLLDLGMFAPEGSTIANATMVSVARHRGRSYGLLALIFGLLFAGLLGFVVLQHKGMLPEHLISTASDNQIAAQNQTELVSLFSAFSADSQQSPRGVSIANVTTAEAIEHAFRSVSSDNGQRDTDEAAFWLRQYLSKQLGDRQTLWALTQLGSTYARPADSPPDYVTARHLWEIAAALGDPVAHCFLGGLYETGLGVAVNKAMALNWYERARRLGGCSKLEAAIARVSQSAAQ